MANKRNFQKELEEILNKKQQDGIVPSLFFTVAALPAAVM